MSSGSTASFLKKGSRFMLLDNISKGLDPLLVLLCAKYYAGGDWGRFKYFESIILLLLRFSTTGMDHAVIWMYSRCKDDSEFLQRFSRTLNFALALSFVFACGSLAQYMGYLPGGHFAQGLDIPVGKFLLFLGALPTQVAMLLLVQALVNKQSLMAGLWVRNIAIPFGVFGLGLLFFFTPLRSSGMALAYFLGNAAGLIIAWIAAVRVFGRIKGWSYSPAIPREVFKYVLPISFSGSLMSMASRFDILFLARFSGATAVEVYSIVQMAANTLNSLKSSMVYVMLSVFSGSKPEAKYDKERRDHFDYATWLVMALQLPFLCIAFLFGRELLSLMGGHYASGAVPLCVAMCFAFIGMSIAYSELLLLGRGRSLIVSISQVIFFGASFALNLLLIPRYGPLGAVVAMGTGQVSAYIVCAAGTRIRDGSWFFSGRLVKELSRTIAFFIPAFLLAFSWPGIGPVSLWVRVVVFLLSLSGYAVYAWKTFQAWHVRIDQRAASLEDKAES